MAENINCLCDNCLNLNSIIKNDKWLMSGKCKKIDYLFDSVKKMNSNIEMIVEKIYIVDANIKNIIDNQNKDSLDDTIKDFNNFVEVKYSENDPLLKDQLRRFALNNEEDDYMNYHGYNM
jgi:hypothetical protein